MSFFTYILYSEKLNKYYVEHTNNLDRRLSEYNSFQSSSNKSGVPRELTFSKKFSTNYEANKFELKIKSMKRRRLIEGLVANG